MGMKNDEIVCLNCSLRVCVCEIYYSAAPAPAAAVYGNKTTLLRDSSTQHHAVQSTAIIIRPNIYKNTPRPFSLSRRATSPAQSKFDALIPSSCCSRGRVMRRKKQNNTSRRRLNESIYAAALVVCVPGPAKPT